MKYYVGDIVVVNILHPSHRYGAWVCEITDYYFNDGEMWYAVAWIAQPCDESQTTFPAEHVHECTQSRLHCPRDYFK